MKKKLSNVQIIALGFFLMIIVGALLLMLPVSAYRKISFGEALFTSTSATCVTGLVVVDTALTFTPFGQGVLLLLIQTGGLGFMTIAVFFLKLLRKRVGLREKEIITEGLSSSNINEIPKMIGFICKGVVFTEGIGAAVLSVRFIPLFGVGKGIWYSVFHSVSAFCNAGFDLMGTYSGEYSSFTAFYDDCLVTLTLTALILIGGLGFYVWADLCYRKTEIKKWKLHTKIVIITNLFLIIGGAALFFMMEKEGTMSSRILCSVFDAVTPRTAGFNTVDTASLSGGGKLLTMILMLIGGGSGSTAGGIKVTTLAVLIIFAISQARHSKSAFVLRRKINKDILQKAMTVFIYNFSLAIFGAMLIMIIQEVSLEDAVFETLSAIGTVGMSTGITRDLIPVSRLIICMLMFLGRVGSVSFANALLEKRAAPAVEYPEENITVG